MSDHVPDGLDPAGRDLREYTDGLRPEHRVVRSARGEWVLLRHADVVAAAADADTFSSAVSAHLHVPNGLDGTDHAAARATLDAYFTPEAVAPFAPRFREIARALVAELVGTGRFEAVGDLGARFAVRAQTAWLGWPRELEPRLLAWMADNHAATRSGDRSRTAAVAADFDAIIRSVVEPRRAQGAGAPDDLTTRLLRDHVDGRPFTDAEVVSILRNWTGGDLGSIALCVGVLAVFLAEHPREADRLRAGVPDDAFDKVIDEVLRIDDPFIANRRRTTCPVDIAGARIPQGEVVRLHWTSANRDASVFGEGFDPGAHAPDNVVYGIGPHVCPGRLLATTELRIAAQELLAATTSIALDPDDPPEREVAPLGGYARVPLVVG